MIIAIDIGNTNIVIGGLKNQQVIFKERIATDPEKTELEYAILLRNIMDLYQVKTVEIEGFSVASVVPNLTEIIKRAIKKLFPVHKIIVLGPGVKTGLNIALDNPAEMGADQVAIAVAVCADYDVPAVIVDLGTATVFSVVDENKRFLGGLLMPGVNVSLNALTSQASLLNAITIEQPKKLIGRNTIDCMKSGIFYGTAASIDGVIDRLQCEIGKEMTVIATGGLSAQIIPNCKHPVIQDDNLLLRGLEYIYRKNVI